MYRRCSLNDAVQGPRTHPEVLALFAPFSRRAAMNVVDAGFIREPAGTLNSMTTEEEVLLLPHRHHRQRPRPRRKRRQAHPHLRLWPHRPPAHHTHAIRAPVVPLRRRLRRAGRPVQDGPPLLRPHPRPTLGRFVAAISAAAETGVITYADAVGGAVFPGSTNTSRNECIAMNGWLSWMMQQGECASFLRS